MRYEIDTRIDTDAEVPEIPVIDPDYPGSGFCCRIELLAVVDFDKNRKADLPGKLQVVAKLRRIERGDDQKNGVGADKPRLVNLAIYLKSSIKSITSLKKKK